MKRVAIGCSTDHNYCFLLPIAAFLWRERIGYDPILYLVGKAGERAVDSWESSRHAAVAWKAVRWGGFRYEFIDGIEGVEEATVAQSIRHYAAARPGLAPDDLLIPSDADLLPIRREFYHQHDPAEKPVASYYSNGYGESEEGKHFPTCHISAQVSTWRELMGIRGWDEREAVIEQFTRRGLAARMAAKAADPSKWDAVWFEDEYSISERILMSRFWPHGVKLIRREGQPPRDRLDRARWPAKYDALDYTDCHSIRPGWSDPDWPRLRPLVAQVMPDLLAWCDKYRDAFREAMGVAE